MKILIRDKFNIDFHINDIVLDIGAKENTVVKELNQICYAVGIDINISRLYYRKNIVLSDCEAIPFKDNAFTKIIFTEVIEHVTHDSKAIMEINRVLKKEGLLYLSTPNKELSFTDPAFLLMKINSNRMIHRHYSINEIQFLLQDNFEIEYIEINWNIDYAIITLFNSILRNIFKTSFQYSYQKCKKQNGKVNICLIARKKI
jgi:ubiquinone/menaquinone biosynthesis C-methylase UbiE